MKQPSQISGRLICNKIIFVMIMFLVLTIVQLASARENANNFAFTGMNGISNKSSSMFYNDNSSDNGKVPASFTAAVGHKLSDGIEVTAAGSQYPVKLIPITLSQGMGTRSGNRITYAVAPNVHIIYTFKKNGIKEDIVFDHPPATALDIAFRLELDPMLEARLDKKGNILIYGPISILSGFIQTGDEKSADLVLNARQHAPKDNLLYIIPVPVVIDGMGIKHINITHYSLEKSILTVHATGLAHLPVPVSIDPSIVVTTTADFMTGNNEGMISFDTDAISRSAPSGGSIGNWTATTSFTTPRTHHTSVAYNGYLYVIGGTASTGYLNNVNFAPIYANGTVGSWSSTTSFATARYAHTSLAYNGYLYVIGGWNGGNLNDVQVALINSNGTLGAWTATTSFLTPRWGHTSVVYNGYLYVMGGTSGSSGGPPYFNDVQLAQINANGTISSWTATTSFPAARYGHTSIAYNGYLYVMGGHNNITGDLNEVDFAPINSDGTIGSWNASTSLPAARIFPASAAYNGYLYIIGGINSGILNDVQFASINTNGTIGSWTATTSYSGTPQGHTSVAHNGYLYIIGGYDGYNFLNDVRYAPVNANGMVGSWTDTTSCPCAPARYGHASVAYNGYLYVIGGFNNTYLNDVQYAPIHANGTVGTWAATTSFTMPRFGHAAVIYNGYLYIIGGWNGTYLNDVQYAPIGSSGTVGTWTTTTSFTTPRFGHTSAAYNGFLYIIGGYSGTYLNDVQMAPIDTYGPIGAWTATTSFPTPRYYHTSMAYGGYLYIIAGFGNTYLNDVLYASISANGMLGLWNATTSFPSARANHTSAAFNGYLYVIGGEGSTGYFHDVQFAPINVSGTIGTWTTATNFSTARYSHASAAYNGFLYIIGGYNGTILGDVQFAPINANGTNGAWAATSSFSIGRLRHSSVAYNGYLYIIGGDGSDGDVQNDIQFAPINTDGTVGTWATTSFFPIAREAHTSVAYNGYLYIMGGNDQSKALNDVRFAPINSNGTIGTWSATSSFNIPRQGHKSVAYNGYLYVIGGGKGPGNYDPYLNDVQYAPINANGTLGAWSASTSFTTERGYHTSVAYNGYLYVIGGWNGIITFNDVQFAPINSDGTIGTWSATSSLNNPRWGHTSVAYNGYLYVIEGDPFGNDVQFAPINSNGTIGSWTTTTSFTTARSGHTSVAYNGYLYVIGGWNGSYLTDVQFTTLKGPAARAYYSKLLDIGSDQMVESIQFSSSGGKGITNLSYMLAPSSTAVFGSRTLIPGALPSTVYATGLNSCGRYMWVRFDLDDTLNATIDTGGLNGRGDLLDFTVTYDAITGVGTSLLAIKSAPNVHLSWSASPGATSYIVLRCNAAISPCTPVSIASPSTNSYDDPVLSDGTNYWYLIQAINGACTAP